MPDFGNFVWDATADAGYDADSIPDGEHDEAYLSYSPNTEYTIVSDTPEEYDRLKELAQMFPAVYILSEYPSTVCVETNRAAELVIETGFPAKSAVFIATPDHDGLLIAVFGADDSCISVFTLAGDELMRGELPHLEDGWEWQPYAIFSDGPFTIEVDSRNTLVEGTPAEDDPANACLYEIFMEPC